MLLLLLLFDAARNTAGGWFHCCGRGRSRAWCCTKHKRRACALYAVRYIYCIHGDIRIIPYYTVCTVQYSKIHSHHRKPKGMRKSQIIPKQPSHPISSLIPPPTAIYHPTQHTQIPLAPSSSPPNTFQRNGRRYGRIHTYIHTSHTTPRTPHTTHTHTVVPRASGGGPPHRFLVRGPEVHACVRVGYAVCVASTPAVRKPWKVRRGGE